MSKKNILSISGNARRESSNHNLIKAIADIASKTFTINIVDGLADLPTFQPFH